MPILYPVAENVEGALAAPLGFAAREREAVGAAGAQVKFVTEETGPAFESREAALDAYAGRLDDDRPGRVRSISPEAKWCDLKTVAPQDAKGRRRVQRPTRPVNRNGRRWPAPAEAKGAMLWRLCVSYWRVRDGMTPEDALDPARKLRRDRAGEDLPVGALRALASQPLRPVKPQQPLDIGLFETRMPEAPHLIMPDE